MHFYLIFLNFLSVFTVFIFFFFNEVTFSISLSDVSFVLECELLLLKSIFLFDLLFSKYIFSICFFEDIKLVFCLFTDYFKLVFNELLLGILNVILFLFV